MLWFKHQGKSETQMFICCHWVAADPSQYLYCLSQASTMRLLLCHHIKIGTTDVVLVNLQSRWCRSSRLLLIMDRLGRIQALVLIKIPFVYSFRAAGSKRILFSYIRLLLKDLRGFLNIWYKKAFVFSFFKSKCHYLDGFYDPYDYS